MSFNTATDAIASVLKSHRDGFVRTEHAAEALLCAVVNAWTTDEAVGHALTTAHRSAVVNAWTTDEAVACAMRAFRNTGPIPGEPLSQRNLRAMRRAIEALAQSNEGPHDTRDDR